MRNHSAYCMSEYWRLWKHAGFPRNGKLAVRAQKKVFGPHYVRVGPGVYVVSLQGIEGCCDWDRRTTLLLRYLGGSKAPKRYLCVSCSKPAWEASEPRSRLLSCLSCMGPERPEMFERKLCSACARIVLGSARARFGRYQERQGDVMTPFGKYWSWEAHPFERLSDANVRIARLCLLGGLAELVHRRSEQYSEAN